MAATDAAKIPAKSLILFDGGQRSQIRTRLCRNFPANREKYREILVLCSSLEPVFVKMCRKLGHLLGRRPMSKQGISRD
jgi:hypothetical protein